MLMVVKPFYFSYNHVWQLKKENVTKVEAANKGKYV